MVSIVSGSEDPVPLSVTVSGTQPLVGLTLRFAVGAAFDRQRLSVRNAYAAAPVVSGIVSFVPPVPGTSEGAVARTLARLMLTACPAPMGEQVPPGQSALDSIALFGSTKVIVPSLETVLAASSVPMVTKNRDAPWNTPVVP